MAKLLPIVRDLAGATGAASVAYGAWLVYEPSGFIVGGLITMALVFLAARQDQ